jgi:hypothetical protein
VNTTSKVWVRRRTRDVWEWGCPGCGLWTNKRYTDYSFRVINAALRKAKKPPLKRYVLTHPWVRCMSAASRHLATHHAAGTSARPT